MSSAVALTAALPVVAVLPLPATGQSVGIDLGLASFLMTDTGKPEEHPQPLRDPFWNYVVLGAAAVFEGASFTVAWREFRKERRGRPMRPRPSASP